MARKEIKLAAITLLMGLLITILYSTEQAYADSIPKVEKIVGEYDTIYEGDTQTLDILTTAPGKVQYRVWISNKKTGVWEDITKGYTSPVDGNKVYNITTPKLLEGEYGVSVWVKNAGAAPRDKRGFDNYLSSSIKCLKKDGQGTIIKLNNFKNNYAVGETVEIKKEEGKQYLYKFSAYDIINRKEIVSSKDYKENLLWKPSVEGAYLLQINLKIIEKVPVYKDNTEDNKITSDTNKGGQESNTNVTQDTEKVDKSDEVIGNNKTKDVDKNKTEDVDKNKTEIIDKSSEDKINEAEDKTEEDKDKKEEIDGQSNENEEKKNDEVEYKEIEREIKINKLIIVGNPYRYKGPKAPSVSSLVVGNAGEVQRIYIKAEPKTKSKNVGYIYGSLQEVKIIKKVGNYYYIEAKDYNSLNLVRGYVLTSQLKTVKPQGKYSILVDISDQRVYVFNSGKLQKTIICSTGQDWTPTPTGTYLVGDRGAYFYTGYKNSVICYNWVRINNNFLFHSVLCDRKGRVIQSEAAKLGEKASHGCIRMPLSDIKWIYNTIPKGTLVVIQQ